MTKTALILIDIQNDYFPGGMWPVAKMDSVSGNAAKLLARFRAAGDMVVHLRHEIPSDQAPFFRPGSVGAQIHASVAAQGDEPVLLKHKPSSFIGTDLLDRLQAGGITRVVICGAMSQMCIDATSRAAADLGFEVVVIEDACGAKEMEFGGVTLSAEQVHAAFMAPLAMSYGTVTGTADFLADA
jgi:nicotinamidase-related amidase